MNSMLLIIAGVVGLLICGLVRLMPYAKGLLKVSPSGELHKVVDAYSVLHDCLAACGEAEQAKHLRTKILPAAVKMGEE